eukprot:TRINITY_DN31158_c0_g1_i1.p1 TRINITY_DN31158_c0_g1~~TRINITY_DN31158_c0_g1_i1.p1  ORF type:complete len:265 (+),score=29.91 TRINITY_DN31158_c0_g1_i1:57-797(+)
MNKKRAIRLVAFTLLLVSGILFIVAMAIPGGIARVSGRYPRDIWLFARSLDPEQDPADLWKDCGIFDCPLLDECTESNSIRVTGYIFCSLTCFGFFSSAGWILATEWLPSRRMSVKCASCILMMLFGLSIFSWALIVSLYSNVFCEYIKFFEQADLGMSVPLMVSTTVLSLVACCLYCCQGGQSEQSGSRHQSQGGDEQQPTEDTYSYSYDADADDTEHQTQEHSAAVVVVNPMNVYYGQTEPYRY